MNATPAAAIRIVVQGKVSADDVACARAMHGRGSVILKVLAVLMALLALLVFVDTAVYGRDLDELISAGRLMVIAIGAVTFAFVFPLIWRPQETPGRELSRIVTREGIHVEDAAEQRLVPWERVIRGRTSEMMGIVYTRGPREAYLFPRRLFASDEEWSGFRELLERRAL